MDVPVEPPEDKHSLDQDLPALRGVADLYVQAKALILYSEEVDPESRSNLQVIKELRDAFDHLMRVIVARLGSEVPPGASDPEYCSKNTQKAIGHIYRAAFDALDGTVLSLRVKITEVVDNYSLDVLNAVVPNYWDIKCRLNDLSGRITEHRARKDVGSEIGITLDRYVADVEIIKGFYKDLLSYGPALDEYSAKLAVQERHHRRKDRREQLFIATASAVVGGLLVAIASFLWLGGD